MERICGTSWAHDIITFIVLFSGSMLFYTPLQSVSNSNTTSRERAHPPSLSLSLSLSFSLTLGGKRKKKKSELETKPKDYIRIESIGKTLSLCFSFFLSPQEKPLASKHFSRPSIIRPTRKCRRRTEKDRNRAEKDEKGSSILEPVLLPLTKTRKRYRSCVLLVAKRSYHCANFRKIDLCALPVQRQI